MRRVCLAHNLLREPERRAFHGLVVAGRALEDVARSLGASGVEVARLARRGLEAVLIAAGQAGDARERGSAEPAAEAPRDSAPENTNPHVDDPPAHARGGEELEP